MATGSPFPSVTHAGRTLRVSQANNAYIFPGLGLGVLVSQAREVTDLMFTAAARALAELVHADDLAQGALLAATRLKVAVPRRVAVAGFNDLTGSDQMQPALTTVRTPRRLASQASVPMTSSASTPSTMTNGQPKVRMHS